MRRSGSPLILELFEDGASRIILTGPSASGKSDYCRQAIEEGRSVGRSVGGVVAPAVLHGGQRIGSDAVDILTGERCPLTRAFNHASAALSRRPAWRIIPSGLQLSRRALANALAAGCDLIIADEFGPLEMAGGGLRAEVESVWAAGNAVLLVVRPSLLSAALTALGWPHDLKILSL